MTDPTQVPGLSEWKARLWEVNREIKSLLMLSNITTVEGLVAYVGWHGTKELEAMCSPEDFARFIDAMETLRELLPTPRDVEVVNERKEALVTERSTLNLVKDMFL